MSPPLPPSPPLGPPRGTNFSRRKAKQPLPPSPAFTEILTSSMNMDGPRLRPWDRLGARPDVDETAHAAAIAEFDHAGHFGEQRVILAPADVFARLQARAALPHDDGAAGHQLPAENLHAEALRVGIAPIF